MKNIQIFVCYFEVIGENDALVIYCFTECGLPHFVINLQKVKGRRVVKKGIWSSTFYIAGQ